MRVSLSRLNILRKYSLGTLSIGRTASKSNTKVPFLIYDLAIFFLAKVSSPSSSMTEVKKLKTISITNATFVISLMI